MPMPDDAQDWYRSVLDDDGVVRNSVARIEDGVLHIEQGPLVGQEARVKKKTWTKAIPLLGSYCRSTFLAKRRGDVAPAIPSHF